MKKLLLKTMLLLCALVAGSASVWADTASFSYTDFKGQGSSGTGGDLTGATTGDITITGKGNGNNTYLQVYGGNYLIITPNSGATITKIELTATTSSYIKTWSASDESKVSVSSSKATWSGSSTSAIKLTNTASAQARITSIVVTYTAAVKTDPTITFNNGNVNVGKTLNLNSLFTSNSAGSVTYSIISGDSYATLDGSTMIGVAEGNVTVQASQAAAGAYNAKTATATITVNAALTLSSIAVTTAPTKTTYTEGETFDATGMVVTATYSDSSTDDITASCTWSPSGALSTSDVMITISYTENEITKTATQSITVNPYVQPNPVTIDMNYEWLGSSNGANLGSEDLPVIKVNDRVTITITDGESTHPRGDTDYIRVYNGSTITFDAPTGYSITSLVFTTGGKNTWTEPTANEGELVDKTWTGNATSVEFSLSGSCFIASVEVALTKATATINLAAACTDGDKCYGTYSNSKAFIVPADLTVYEVSVNEGALRLEAYATDEVVPANTGVLVAGTAGDHNVMLTTGGTSKLGSGNMLKASGDEGIDATSMNVADTKFYRLTMHEGTQIGFFWGAADGAAFDVAANKAYLAVPTGQTGEVRGFNLNDGADAISEIMKNEKTSAIYDLSGRRVVKATKGLYIVNGKKVVK